MAVVQDILAHTHTTTNHHPYTPPHTTADTDTDTIIAKGVAMCVLFLASLIIGLTPLKLSRTCHWSSGTTTADPKQHPTVSTLLCFGGGVLLCTTFLHLLPEVTESIAALQSSGDLFEMRVHLAPLLMCVGFFSMYLVEEAAHYYIHRTAHSCHHVPTGALRRSLSVRTRAEIHDSAASTNDLVVKTHIDTSHSHFVLINNGDFAQSLRGFLVVLSLSVHELFEGLAVGLESSAASVWYMFGAVSAHKLVIAFCIGVELITTKTRAVLIVVYVVTFAVVSPLGIGVGILISEQGDGVKTDLSSAVLQGLATGTLLYVVFFEVLQRETISGLKPFVAVLVGFLVMLAITALGIGIGIVLRSRGDAAQADDGEGGEDVTSVVLQGMAAGTLLYVVFFEVLAREKSNGHGANGLCKLMAIVAGFCVMLALQVATGHEHNHEDGHEDGGEHLATSAAVTPLSLDDFTHAY